MDARGSASGGPTEGASFPGKNRAGIVIAAAPSLLARVARGWTVDTVPVIASTPGRVARAPSGWTVDRAPDLKIGVVDGAEADPYLFSWITGIRQLPDRRILVVDATTCD